MNKCRQCGAMADQLMRAVWMDLWGAIVKPEPYTCVGNNGGEHAWEFVPDPVEEARPEQRVEMAANGRLRYDDSDRVGDDTTGCVDRCQNREDPDNGDPRIEKPDTKTED